MRIDLIPDVPVEPVRGKKRVVVSESSRRTRKSGEQPEQTQYTELLQSIYDGAIITDADGRVIEANARAVEFLVYTREELCDLSIFDVISGADESLIGTLLENLENERFTLIQAYCIRKDGTFFPAEIAVNKLEYRGLHLCFFVRDITLRRQAEEMLRTEHNAIHNAGNGIAVSDLKAELEYANPAVYAMWGYQRKEEMEGMSVVELFDDRQVAEDMIRTVAEEERAWMGEATASGKAPDSRFEVQISAALNRNSDGEPVGMVFSFIDISDRKRAEKAVMEADRQRVMLESLGAACHHLGQPATVLLANLGILRNKLDGQGENMRHILDSSMESAEAISEILHKLNQVNEYRTTRYLDDDEDADHQESRILEI
jgi:PAS domain S-box-containing protein